MAGKTQLFSSPLPIERFGVGTNGKKKRELEEFYQNSKQAKEVSEGVFLFILFNFKLIISATIFSLPLQLSSPSSFSFLFFSQSFQIIFFWLSNSLCMSSAKASHHQRVPSQNTCCALSHFNSCSIELQKIVWPFCSK